MAGYGCAQLVDGAREGRGLWAQSISRVSKIAKAVPLQLPPSSQKVYGSSSTFRRALTERTQSIVTTCQGRRIHSLSTCGRLAFGGNPLRLTHCSLLPVANAFWDFYCLPSKVSAGVQYQWRNNYLTRSQLREKLFPLPSPPYLKDLEASSGS